MNLRLFWKIAATWIGLAATVSSGGIDRLPHHTLLWNRFHEVIIANNWTLALASEGIAIFEYDARSSSFIQINQLFLDDEPVRMKARGDTLIVRTMHDNILLVDIAALPTMTLLNEVEIPTPVADFDLHGSDLYIAAWFSGILRYSLNDENKYVFADSSMKPVLTTRLMVNGNWLYALDEYNGIARFDIGDSTLSTFVDYLFIPRRAVVFDLVGNEFIIGAVNGGILFGEFQPTGQSVAVFHDESSPFVRLLNTADWFVMVAPRTVELMNRADRQQRVTFEIGDNLPAGDIIFIDEEAYLVLPGGDGGLVLYSLQQPGRSRLAFDRPGPIRGLTINNGHLYTGGSGNPVDVYSLDRWRERPRLDYTLFPELSGVQALDRNGDSLVILYRGMNKIAFISSVGDPDNYQFVGSITVGSDDAFEVDYIDRWPAHEPGVMVAGRHSINFFSIDDSTGLEHTAEWRFLG